MLILDYSLTEETDLKNLKLGDLIPYYFYNSLLGLVINKHPTTILLDTMQIKVLDLQMINVYQLNNNG